MDDCHVELIAAYVRALKPGRVLEFGFGTGKLTAAILRALYANQKGTLTTIDNWLDWQGQRPFHVPTEPVSRWSLYTADETTTGIEEGVFDIIIADGDHGTVATRLASYRPCLRSGGVLFVHDMTCVPEFLAGHARLFNISSVEGERCERGLLLAW